MSIKALTLAILLGLTAVPGHADQSVAALIADGQPWNGTGPGGRAIEITFFPDGTVRMKAGIMRMSMRWTATEDGMCMSGGPGGDRCVVFVPQGTGFVGTDGIGDPLVLTR